MAKAKKVAEPKPVQISEEEFLKGAKSLSVRIGDVPMLGVPRKFASGSLGWFVGDKVMVPCPTEAEPNKQVRCQLTMSLVVVGSKPE